MSTLTAHPSGLAWCPTRGRRREAVGAAGAGHPSLRVRRQRYVERDRVTHPDPATGQDTAHRARPPAQRRRRTGGDLVVQDPAGCGDPDDLQQDLADDDPGPRRRRHVEPGDGHVASGAFRRDRDAQLGGGLGEPLGGLHGDVPVPGAVVAVADDPAAGLHDDLVDRLHRQPPARRDAQRHDGRGREDRRLRRDARRRRRNRASHLSSGTPGGTRRRTAARLVHGAHAARPAQDHVAEEVVQTSVWGPRAWQHSLCRSRRLERPRRREHLHVHGAAASRGAPWNARSVRTSIVPFLTDSRNRTRLGVVPTASEFEPLLREARLRVTRPRLAVLSAVRDHPHADTDSLIGVVRADLGEVSHQAVYDVLRVLTQVGLVRRIQPPGSVGPLRVAGRGQPPPPRVPHVRCRSSTSTAPSGTTPCLTASDDHGFTIDEAEVVYWGLCPACSIPSA